jgi:hypothetical protein
MITTRAQREAMLRLFRRDPVYVDTYGEMTSRDMTGNVIHHGPLTYRQFRRKVQSGRDCLMVKLWGMWIGIEADGYTHS